MSSVLPTPHASSLRAVPVGTKYPGSHANGTNMSDGWSVQLSVSETDGETNAEARLLMDGDVQRTGRGRARLNPADRDVVKIGAEIAMARPFRPGARAAAHCGRRCRGHDPRAGPSAPVKESASRHHASGRDQSPWRARLLAQDCGRSRTVNNGYDGRIEAS